MGGGGVWVGVLEEGTYIDDVCTYVLFVCMFIFHSILVIWQPCMQQYTKDK